MKKMIIALLAFYASFNAYSCTDIDADILVKDRAIQMAKRYSASTVGIGVSILWDNLRATAISIPNGNASPSSNGEKMDRIGSIYIDMNTCVVKAKLIGAFDIIDVE